MGGCASKPKDLDTETVPTPVEVPHAPIETPEKAEPEPVAQTEVKDGDETKEEGLVEVSEVAPEVAEVAKEAKTEEKPAIEAAVPVEAEATEAKAEIVEEAKEEDKKEAAPAVATA